VAGSFQLDLCTGLAALFYGRNVMRLLLSRAVVLMPSLCCVSGCCIHVSCVLRVLRGGCPKPSTQTLCVLCYAVLVCPAGV
jgi:hypothetical protein